MSTPKAAGPANGIYNTNGFLWASAGPVFIALVPVTSWLTTPGGLVEKAVHGLINTTAFIGSAGSTTTISKAGAIPALTAVYIAVTYALSGAASVGGVAAASPNGRDNNHPRAQEANLKGLPLRLKSAHMNLVEMFPGFAITAALAATMAPTDQQVINLLGLHVLAKVALYYPAYLANIDGARSLGHLLATSSVINVAWRLATGAN